MRLKHHQLKAILQSHFVQNPEDEILNVVLDWCQLRKPSKQDMLELVSLIRMPFVALGSTAMGRARKLDLLTDDMLRICNLFQTDGDYRATVMNTETMHRPRFNSGMRGDLEFRPRLLRDYSDLDFVTCRMFGVVNGRRNFGKIASVHVADSGGNLVFAICLIFQSKAIRATFHLRISSQMACRLVKILGP